MRIAVTGGTGFLGSHLCASLLAGGHTVRTLVRSPERAAWLAARGCEVVRADLTEPDSLRDGLHGCEVLVANAAMGSRQGDLAAMQRINVDGVEHSLRAAAAVGCRRIVLVSTTAVYRTRLHRLLDESATPTDPVRHRWDWKDLTTDWRYAITKKRGEDLAWRLADELDLALTSVQPCPVYGPRDPKLSARLLAGLERRVVVLPTARVPLVHAGDVADAVTRAAERPETAGRPYIVAGPAVSLVTLVRRLRHLAGRGPRVVPVPVPVAIHYDSSAAVRDLDFHSRPLDEGLRELLRAG